MYRIFSENQRGILFKTLTLLVNWQQPKMSFRKTLLLIVIFSNVLSTKVCAQIANYSTKDGLVFNNVDYISEDDEGLMYFATGEGINIFDGSQFTLFNLHNTTGFSNKISQAIFLKKGLILIGTHDKGLFVWDKFKKMIIPIILQKDDLDAFLSISTMFIDSSDMVWIGSDDGTLFSFPISEINSKTSDYALNDVAVITKLPGDIHAILEVNNTILIGADGPKITRVRKTINNYIIDQPLKVEGAGKINCLEVYNETLFLGADSGLFKLDNLEKLENNTSQTLTTPWKLRTVIIRTISNHSNTIWVGTEGEGLFNFSTDGSQLEHLTYAQNKQNSLSSNYVLTTFIDSTNNLWAGTWFGGVNVMSLGEKNYSIIHDSENENNLFSNIIWAIAQIPDGRTFLGTHGNGLGEYSVNQKNFISKASNEEIKFISSLYYDPISKLLFIGTWGHGIKIYDPYAHKLVPTNPDFKPLQHDRIYAITRGPDNRLWLGSSENGLYRYSINHRQLEKIQLPNETLQDPTDIRCLLSDDKNKRIWAGSIKNGIYSININAQGAIDNIEQFEEFASSKDKIYAENLYIHDNGDLWILCRNGIGTIKPNGRPQRLSIIDGCVVTGMDSDTSGNVWIGTHKGLFKVDPETLVATYTLSQYSFYDLLFDSKDNTLVSGTDNGLLKVKTEQPLTLPPYPNILLSDLYTLNQTIIPQKEFSGDVILPQNLNYCDTIVLPYYCQSFSIGFNALAFTGKNKVNLLHKLNNFEQEYRLSNDLSGIANYTNVPPGTYDFEVKVGYKHIGWNPQSRILTIVKLAPWWKTPLAYFLYALGIVLFTFFAIREILTRLRISQELKIEKIKQGREQELYQQKLSFFTNISHDIRTPLTLIIGPLEEILTRRDLEEELQKKMKRMHKSANTLLNLVNQILNFRKAESDNMVLEIEQIEVNGFVQNICSQFYELAQAKELDFEVSIPEENLILAADPAKLESILINLISNAVKFTPQYGQITVHVSYDKKYVSISVSDTGIGIPKNELDLIFTRFYRSKKSAISQGTGIGIALAKKYTELHNGKIEVQSLEDRGSEFIVRFPIIEELSEYPEHVIRATKEIEPVPMPVSESISEPYKKLSVLVIDDSKDIREYLVEILEKEYRLFTAENGKEGLAITSKKMPDLVISDVMMDGMDGMEVCRQIKSNLNTSHIPVILLTAKTSMEYKIEGIEKGADAYMEKPFNSQFLLTRVKKLIEHREVLRKKLLRSDTLLGETIPSSVDEKFIEKVIGHIESNISESEFSVQSLIENMNMSQDQLYRKIKALTGLSINHFIRLVRLKKAARLLTEGHYTVSEIVFEVGFNNPSYFTRCFKAEFGVLPSEFAQVQSATE